MGERRRASRQKSFLRGCIYFNKRRSVADCLIRDISDEGAKIIFSDTINIPDVIELYIPQKEQTLRAQVQWRHGNELGVTFGEAPALSHAGRGRRSCRPRRPTRNRDGRDAPSAQTPEGRGLRRRQFPGGVIHAPDICRVSL